MTTIILSILLLTGSTIYLMFTRWVYRGLGKLKEEPLLKGSLPTVSVIVPAKNEAHNIEETLESLAGQDYPAGKYEVIMVNDRSDDDTPLIMNEYTRKHKNFVQVNIENLPPNISPKKNAVEWGVTAAKGEIIATTDADCIHSPLWLHTIVSSFKPDVGLVAGLAVLEPDDESWAHRLHALDYISHTLVGAGAIGNGSAMNCTAANLAYRYQTFMELGGFGETGNLVSGDDEFFLHRMIGSKKWKATYAVGEHSIVRSLPPETIKGILNQRLRWGSKGIYYPPKVKRLAVSIFLFLLIMMTSPILVIFDLIPLSVFLLGVGMKLFSDYTVMKRGFRIFNLKFYMIRFLLLFILHPLEIVLSAAGGHLLPFNWKGELFRSKLKTT